ncbi:Nramp family divalent metal transporter [Sphingomonas prati]|uniref:Divalent metal cation transporter MntH n=1 Tax=Sphingomonas prati TaxID=1843237 RepID=A0A7W9F2M9_9SPHN|nr:Nramp family divalent metal transporter [Sphingomonas prati]MBB5730697.1 manganese transport protein [Sphingomonas prati]GGE95883.1 divalent metal cation transporter MntH [Sphingomonas prati]
MQDDHQPTPPVAAGPTPTPRPLVPSLPEVFRSIAVPGGAKFWRKLAAFSGPGYLVAVGYMDPGNWATDLAGGSQFGYTLLSVILLSNVMAILLQSLAAKLGIVTGRDLAQACRDSYSRPVGIMLWALCELAIVACDLAEVIGTAIALQLLFGLPLVWGICLTAFDVLLILLLQQRGFRLLEAFIVTLLVVIAGSFIYELFLSRPELSAVMAGFVPQTAILTNPAMLYIAIGIIGATVMPHNLYLHSSIVQTRAFDTDTRGKREAVLFATIDSTIALMLALFINAAILILAASAFHVGGQTQVAEIQDAYQLLSPTLGAAAASTLFAVALLASGQNSTVTATLAGQIVMEGFLHVRLRPWVRRLITRMLAIVPAVAVALIYGEQGTARLLVLSQVVLSMQLPFAVIPLVSFTSNREKMGDFANPTWLKIAAWTIAAIIVGLNVKLLLSVAGIW